MLSKLEILSESLQPYLARNKGTLWQAIKAYRANLRQGTLGVKTRAMVVSTGKKPYNQKKTGNARRGSFVSPLHVGGGVAHGPKARDHREALPPKMARVALGIALAHSVKAGRVFLGNLSVASGKTREAATLLKGSADFLGRTLVCLHQADDMTLRAFRNIRGVYLVDPRQVTAYGLLRSRTLVASPEAFKILEERLSAGVKEGDE